MKSRFTMLSAALALALTAAAAGTVPTVSGVTLTQDQYTRRVTVGYTLANGPAIITVSFATNGVALPAAVAASRFLAGDVDKVVAGDGSHSFVWDACGAWPGLKVKDFSAVVTARAVDDPPDYMVVDLMPGSAERVRYFNSTNDLPGGLFGNPAYRTTHLVMRRIRMKNVPWVMGSATTEGGGVKIGKDATRFDDETQHTVTFANDYWFSIFPVTQAQYTNTISGAFTFNYKTRGEMRPADNQSIVRLRQNKYSSGTAEKDIIAANHYPNSPHPDSFIGRLRTRTGIEFDLPGEAQWECACRAGTGSSQWNNGAYFKYSTLHIANDTAAGFPGRYQIHSKWTGSAYSAWDAATTDPDVGGTAIVGSYEPNAWGIYDMHGNVWEATLDYKQSDITGPEFAHGEINANGANKLDGSAGGNIIYRGGNCGANGQWFKARSAYRNYSIGANTATLIFGFRVVCYGTLK